MIRGYNRLFAILVMVLAITINVVLVLHDAAARVSVPSTLSQTTTPAYAEQAAATYSFTVFLPVTEQNSPPHTVFGVEVYSLDQPGGLNALVDAKASWVRRSSLVWSAVEPSEGTRNWSTLGALEQDMINASSNSLHLILIVQNTPNWAQQYSNTPCGPILPSKLGAFANFMHDTVARYSVAPFNVHYWEIWNEPDIDHSLGITNTGFGCWGDATDAYYGGGYYAQMLQAVYPQIKSADPNAKVLVGGLLLDCDPSLAGACADDKPPRFLEGILRAGGGAYFDGVGFHGYDYYNGALGHYSNPNWRSAWTSTIPQWPVYNTGPVGIAKGRFVKNLLSRYGVTGKFLVNTESALLCKPCVPDSTFETTKAYYLAQVYASAIAEGYIGDVWYSYEGWLHSGLSDHGTLLPAYTAFQFANSKLELAKYSYDVTAYGGVKGYVFARPNGHIWIVWSLDGIDHPISLPQAPSAVWDALGNPVTASGSTLTVTITPLYVELP